MYGLNYFGLGGYEVCERKLWQYWLSWNVNRGEYDRILVTIASLCRRITLIFLKLNSNLVK